MTDKSDYVGGKISTPGKKRTRLPAWLLPAMAWLRAWVSVARDPDKPMPAAPVPAEGVPIPRLLGLHCSECDSELAGLRQWYCRQCGQRFNPHRLYTLRMLEQPEYFLRYRYGPDEIRSVLWSVVLVALAGVLLLTAESNMVLRVGLTLAGFFGIILLPNLLLVHWEVGWSWPRLFFWVSLLFFLGMVLFVGTGWFV